MATENLREKEKKKKRETLTQNGQQSNYCVPINLSNYKADVNIHNTALYLVQCPGSRENNMSVVNLNNSLAETY